MNVILKTICILVLLPATAMAGRLDIVQLGPPDVTSFEIACGGANQKINLPYGATTGGFVLPEKDGTLSIPQLEIPTLTIPATALSNIAVLVPAEDGFRWKLIPGKPARGKWAMRVVNLGTEPVALTRDGIPLEIKPDSITETPVKGKRSMSIHIVGTEKRSYEGKEACAILALVYLKDDKWEVLFIPDR